MLPGREFSGIGLGVATLVIWYNVFLGIGSLPLRACSLKKGLRGYRRKASRCSIRFCLGIGAETYEKLQK